METTILGFKVEGFGFQGFRVQGLGFRVQSFGFRGLRFRVQSLIGSYGST